MALNILGLKTLKIGACGTNGTMGITLVQVGHIVKDTAVFQTEDMEQFVNEVEDFSFPVEIIPTKNGKATLAFATKDFDPPTLVKLFGGTATGSTKWDAPVDPVLITQSIEVVTKSTASAPNGMKLTIPKAQLMAKMQSPFKNGENAQVVVTAIVLTPTDAGNNALSGYQMTKL